MNHLHLLEVDSTNAWLRSNLSNCAHGFVVSTDYQTTGKGQANNQWESKYGANLLMSILLEPTKIAAHEQFLLSQLVSVAIVNVLQNALNKEVRIKWPNDIYVGDKKVCGILIENTIIGGKLAKSIIGVGINVNQKAFKSDAPNPVSMFQIAGKLFDYQLLLEELASTILKEYDSFSTLKSEELQHIYFAKLYRNSGFYPFKINDELVEAEIDSILPTGHIRLHTKKDEYKIFAFKEVQFVL